MKLQEIEKIILKQQTFDLTQNFKTLKQNGNYKLFIS